MTEKVEIRLPQEFLKLSGLTMKELESRSLLVLVIDLLQEGKISLSKAAELTGMTVDQFKQELRAREVLQRGGPQSKEEAEKDFIAAKRL